MSIVFFIIIALIVYIDQKSKMCIFSQEEETRYLSIKKRFITINLVKNRGAALGFMERKRKMLMILTSVVFLIVLYFFIEAILLNESCITRLSLSFIIGGASGNLIDRIKFKYVRDFFSFNFRRSPVFNAADMFIFIGVIALEIAVIFNL